MALRKHLAELFKGFSKLNWEQRIKRLLQMGALSDDDLGHLSSKEPLNLQLAEHMIENVIGYFQMPLGVATNFCIDGKDYVIPMAVEETSIVAAASKTARWIRENGELHTWVMGNELIGQLQIANVQHYENFVDIINKNKDFLIEMINQDVAKSMVSRGGGLKDIIVRKVERDDAGTMAVIHLHVDTCDAMGANIINQICETLKEPIENLTNEIVSMCILSNLNDLKLTTAKVIIRNIDPELGQRLAEASHFAKQDPYRAATSNKGVLNGIDAVLIATGNDWRAVETSMHAYACRDGQYRSLTHWEMQDSDLIGTLTAPIIVGTVGGATRVHPTAKMCMNMLGINSANELSRIVAAVGLVQNLGAIRALSTDGIISGHMKLHLTNLSISAGAKESELPDVIKGLEKAFAISKRVSLTHAKNILKDIRNKVLH